MKYCSYMLVGALCFVCGCAGGGQQNKPASTEQRVSSKALDAQIDLLAGQIIGSLTEQKTSKIAIIEFPDLEGKVPDLGKYLVEELTTRLFRTGRFLIIERQLLKKMMEEQKLSASGLIDDKSASRLGRVLGVDALTTGTIADLTTSVKINARLIDAETGSVFAVASVTLPMSREVEILLGRKSGAVAVPDSGRFDGTWDVVLVCQPHESGSLGYSFQFVAHVKDGVLHGQHGVEGAAASLTLDGKINPDGTALISATGLTGDPRYNIDHAQRSYPYAYHISAQFMGSQGVGKRTSSRVCDLTFKKR